MLFVWSWVIDALKPQLTKHGQFAIGDPQYTEFEIPSVKASKRRRKDTKGQGFEPMTMGSTAEQRSLSLK